MAGKEAVASESERSEVLEKEYPFRTGSLRLNFEIGYCKDQSVHAIKTVFTEDVFLKNGRSSHATFRVNVERDDEFGATCYIFSKLGEQSWSQKGTYWRSQTCDAEVYSFGWGVGEGGMFIVERKRNKDFVEMVKATLCFGYGQSRSLIGVKIEINGGAGLSAVLEGPTSVSQDYLDRLIKNFRTLNAVNAAYVEPICGKEFLQLKAANTTTTTGLVNSRGTLKGFGNGSVMYFHNFNLLGSSP